MAQVVAIFTDGRSNRYGCQGIIVDGIRHRVVVLHNIISPHVIPLFQRLAHVPCIELKVIFFSESEGNRQWKARRGLDFDHEIPLHLGVELRGRDSWTYHFNPMVPYRLLREPFDVIMSAGWDSFAARSAFCLCKVLHRLFVLCSGSTINERSWRRTVSLPLVRLMVRGSSAFVACGTGSKEYLCIWAHLRIGYSSAPTRWTRIISGGGVRCLVQRGPDLGVSLASKGERPSCIVPNLLREKSSLRVGSLWSSERGTHRCEPVGGGLRAPGK